MHLPSPLDVAAHKRLETLALDLTKLVRIRHPPSMHRIPGSRLQATSCDSAQQRSLRDLWFSIKAAAVHLTGTLALRHAPLGGGCDTTVARMRASGVIHGVVLALSGHPE
jgi:hypothetical protein